MASPEAIGQQANENAKRTHELLESIDAKLSRLVAAREAEKAPAKPTGGKPSPATNPGE